MSRKSKPCCATRIRKPVSPASIRPFRRSPDRAPAAPWRHVAPHVSLRAPARRAPARHLPRAAARTGTVPGSGVMPLQHPLFSRFAHAGRMRYLA
ncbi:hypothetical protein CBM2586_B10631 [Cupriavidus phytorum]|uniref:Uncharacterized protein n=1 Tax=Cupriavidus taiwanensis TaxID=164546 RepID=A0A375CAC6_9BURK|nr:hypothetical protein CBM2586_B10631 [Cupriavidus taiwanensis]